MQPNRDILADYLDKRIEVTGVFDKFSYYTTGIKQWRTALLQDVYALVDGKENDIGHVWLQYADPLKNFNLILGDRIRCNCRVTSYKKRLQVANRDGLMLVTDFNLCWPTGIEVINRARKVGDEHEPLSTDPAGPTSTAAVLAGVGGVNGTASAADQAVPISPVTMILDVQRLAQRVGGWDALHQLVEALRS